MYSVDSSRGPYRRHRRENDSESELLERNSNEAQILYDGGNADEKEEEEEGGTDFFSVFQFDTSMVVMISVIHLTIGFMRVAELGLYILFNEKLGLAPGEVTLLIAISIAPFMLKFLLCCSKKFGRLDYTSGNIGHTSSTRAHRGREQNPFE